MKDDGCSEEAQLDFYRAAGHWKTILEGCDVLVAGDRPAKIAIVLSGLSSGLSDSRVHLYAMGRSQGGKSWSQRRLGQYLFSNFEAVNSSSAKAPYYKATKDPGCFRHKVRLYDEFADQGEEFQNQIKAFTSQGVDSVMLETVDIRRQFLSAPIEGLPVVWTNSAIPLEGPGAEQILNRFWKINVDESPIQDDTVQEYQRAEEKYGDSVQREKARIDSAKWTISYILSEKGLTVLNPFGDFWDVKVPSNRNFRPMVFNLVKVLAYSNRVLRPYVGKSTILASLSDNLMGFIIWSQYEAYQLKKVPARYLKLLSALVPGRPYSKQELSTAYSEKYPTEQSLSPESCYQYAHHMEKMSLMGSEKPEGSREVQFYTLAVARSSSNPVYGEDGALTGLIFESLEVRIPTVEELAKAIEEMKRRSLTPWWITESSEAAASHLLDLDYTVLIAKTLELPLPSVSGSVNIVSNTLPLESARYDKLASLTTKTLEGGES